MKVIDQVDRSMDITNVASIIYVALTCNCFDNSVNSEVVAYCSFFSCQNPLFFKALGRRCCQQLYVLRRQRIQ